MHILIFNWRDIKHPWSGGSELNVHEMAKRWVTMGHEVTMLASRHTANFFEHNKENVDGVQTIRFGGRFTIYLLFPIYYLLRLRTKCDFLIDVENGIPFFTPFFSSKPKCCLVNHVHKKVFFTEMKPPLSYIGYFLETIAMPFLYRKEKFVVISETTKHELQSLGIKEKNINVVYAGLDHDVYKPGANKLSKPTIIYVGRLRRYKRVDLLITIMPEILKQVPDAQLYIVGDGDEREHLIKLAQDSPVKDHIKIWGFVSLEEKIKLLQESWVMVTPSEVEGWGLSVLEANACGTPAVSFNVPGLSEAIIHNSSGLLSDTTDDLTNNIIRLLRDQQTREDMSRNAIIRAAQFNWKNSAETFLNTVTNKLDPPTTLLIAPLHYIADKNEGSEYTRSWYYLEYLETRTDLHGDIIVGYSDKKKAGNFTIHSLYQTKPKYISNVTRLIFVAKVYLKYKQLLKEKNYTHLWHVGPFSPGETFSLIALFNTELPFLIGPINTPHTFLGSDEGRAMGKKSFTNETVVQSIRKKVDYWSYPLIKAIKILSEKTIQAASLIMVVDQAGKRVLSQYSSHSVMVVKVAENISHFINPNPKATQTDTVTIINVSYLVERKKTEDIINAIDILVNKDKCTNLKVIIIGDGPQKNKLETLANSCNLTKYIEFKGAIAHEKIASEYQNADIFVSASISESMPSMYFEAMASALPLVIARNQTTPDLIKIGMQGYVTNPQDPPDLASKLKQLILNTKQIEELGQQNSKIIKDKYKYEDSMDRIVENVVSTKRLIPHDRTKKLRVLILLACTACVITGIWFISGKQIASGEENFAVFNTREPLALNWLWGEAGTGYVSPFLLPRIPLQLVVSLLSHLAIPLWLIQATFFAATIFVGMTAMYALTAQLCKEYRHPHRIALLAALFYFFNLYTMAQVWNRFLYAGIFSWAYLPVLLYVTNQWLNKPSRKIILLLLGASIFLGLAFTHPAYVLMLLTAQALFIAGRIIGKKNNPHELRLILLIRAGLLLGIWLLINCWWIVPYAKSGADGAGTQLNTSNNMESIRAVSAHVPVTDILFLRHNYFLSKEFYAGWYQHNTALFLSASIFLITIVGLGKAAKNNRHLNIILLFIIGAVLSLGANTPQGDALFQWLFKTIPQTQAWRNPYEKVGILYVFAYTILFAIGIEYFLNRIKSTHIQKIIYSLSIAVFCIMLVWPTWTGKIFGLGNMNVTVKIPQSYQKVNAFLESKKDDARILTTPVNPGDGVRLKWSDGWYTGVVPTEYLFSKPALSKILRTEPYDSKYLELITAFKTKNNFQELSKQMNVGYIIKDSSIDYATNGSPSFTETDESLKAVNYQPVLTVDNLKVYQSQDQSTFARVALEGNNLPNMNYKKLSNTHYTATIKSATEPFTLVLKDTFHSRWTARLNNSTLNTHFMVYKYANAWKVDKKGNYTVELFFK